MTHAPDPAIDGDGHATLSVASILAEKATRPDRPALHAAGTTLSYGELWAQTRAYAGALRARGIGPGDRVAMMVPNVPDFARVYYGALARIGTRLRDKLFRPGVSAHGQRGWRRSTRMVPRHCPAQGP